MSRAPFQVLVLPYWIAPRKAIRYALFQREPATGGYWQGIAGGGEGAETPLAAAQREAVEEAGLVGTMIALDSRTSIPVIHFGGFIWGEETFVIPEYCFGLQVARRKVILSHEHTAVRWLGLEAALGLLHWEGNKTALWELDCRLRRRLAAPAD
jgi:dihydroneopterin triphosphate diphosphatase